MNYSASAVHLEGIRGGLGAGGGGATWVIGIKARRFATVQHSRPRERTNNAFRGDSGLGETHYAACPRPLASCGRRRPPPPPTPSPRFKTLSTAFNLETNLTPCPSVCQPDYSISPRQLVSLPSLGGMRRELRWM